MSQLLLHENIVTVVDRFHGKGRAYLVQVRVARLSSRISLRALSVHGCQLGECFLPVWICPSLPEDGTSSLSLQEYCSQGDLFKVIHRRGCCLTSDYVVPCWLCGYDAWAHHCHERLCLTAPSSPSSSQLTPGCQTQRHRKTTSRRRVTTVIAPRPLLRLHPPAPKYSLLTPRGVSPTFCRHRSILSDALNSTTDHAPAYNRSRVLPRPRGDPPRYKTGERCVNSVPQKHIPPASNIHPPTTRKP